MVPISGFVIKISSRCNLNCSYCYEYNMGDDSWKSMPKTMSIETMSKVMDRIKEHSLKHDFNNISIESVPLAHPIQCLIPKNAAKPFSKVETF